VTFESTAPQPATPEAPREDVVRGALFALLAIPVGVIVWLLIWSIGFIASLVAFGVAVAALWLYRVGTRGAVSLVGALVVTAITAVTLLLAFFAGIVLDGVRSVSDATGLGWVEVVTAPEFWELFWGVLPDALPDYSLDFLIALGFGALGCFTVLRSAFAQAKQGTEPAVAAAPGAADALLQPDGTVESTPPAAVEEPTGEQDAPEAR
jgi:hypothetical protein